MDLQTNRGVKMTFIGATAGVIVRIVLCYLPAVPQSVADQIMYGIFGMFGANVVSQRIADGISKGATTYAGKVNEDVKNSPESGCDGSKGMV